jgi:hypothetical protein
LLSFSSINALVARETTGVKKKETGQACLNECLLARKGIKGKKKDYIQRKERGIQFCISFLSGFWSLPFGTSYQMMMMMMSSCLSFLFFRALFWFILIK